MRGLRERDIGSLGVMGWGLEAAKKFFRRRRRRRRRRRLRPSPGLKSQNLKKCKCSLKTLIFRVNSVNK